MNRIKTNICGDCIKVMKTFETKSVDIVVTDPPYGIGLRYDKYRDTEANWFKLMSEALPEIIRVSKMAILPCCRIVNLKWIYANFPPDWLICWYKGSTGHRSYIGFNDWEPHLVYGKVTDNLTMHDYFQTVSSPKKGTYNHPCPKPIEWANWILERTTKEGDIVLDPFVGSGTTCLSAKQMNRQWIGIDVSPEYCRIACDRLGVSDYEKFSERKIDIFVCLKKGPCNMKSDNGLCTSKMFTDCPYRMKYDGI